MKVKISIVKCVKKASSIGIYCEREVFSIYFILLPLPACYWGYNAETNWLLSLLEMALVGRVCMPQQNDKLASKSYHSDVNMYLYAGVFFLASPLQIQGCPKCNNLSNSLYVMTNNRCSWQLST